MSLKLISPPVFEQITLPQARLHLRLDDDGDSPPAHPDDSLITGMIAAAREWSETYTARALAPQVLELALDSFTTTTTVSTDWMTCCPPISAVTGGTSSGAILLPLPPLISVLSVSYVDASFVTQYLTSSDYVVDDFQQPSWLLPAYGTSWPATAAVINAVRIRYQAGYTLEGDSPDPNPLPASIRTAMLLILGHLYENREETQAGGAGSTLLHEIPLGAQSFLDPYRIRLGLV